MKKFVFLFVLLFVAGNFCYASRFELNEQIIDLAFSAAKELPANSFMVAEIAQATSQAAAETTTFIAAAGDKNAVVAFVLSWFLGYLGIHRLYLGTKTGTFIAYLLTAGGCGIVAFVDWIMLLMGLIDDDISRYIDNPKFIMWSKN